MRKRRPTIKKPAPGRALIWILTFSTLAGAGYWAWRHPSRAPTVTNIYQEPGWMPDHKSSRWTCIVIHHSAGEHGGAEAFDEAHRKRGWDGLGYDFVIGNGSESNDGEVEVGYRWLDQLTGAHCKTDDHYYNEHGIGICLVGNLEYHPPTEKQMQSLLRLARFLTSEFNIPSTAIYTHGGITGKTACPGRYFDLAKFKDRLTNVGQAFLPALPGNLGIPRALCADSRVP